ncbi:flagellar hook-basal body complex protein [Erythrobacter sp. WG]|uniref:flagellar hook-basal body complex protein n=1 Tax=Erythrobacter sp. WG TaxID=2985510 RepID=UPI00226EA164|nr:flagellar hook-basal body complex protein [Erythrobacter sp. WG]MCX9148608.1 flagellar hook-basal body complex protein [Erythrobacter sp. WG]
MSFFTSLSGLKNAEVDLRVIAHNIANSETVGFKKSSAQFADLVATGSSTDPRRSPGIGSIVAGITQDFVLGPLEQTGRSLDLAIDGDGFFSLANAFTGDVSYTRNGNFRLTAAGQLEDSWGNRLQAYPLDQNGNLVGGPPNAPVSVAVPITNPPLGGQGAATLANVTIDVRGIMIAAYSDGSTVNVGQLALATFPAPNGLRSIGQTKWQATGDSGGAVFGVPAAGTYGKMISGALERSNVDLAEEMVSLLTAQRNFQANAKAIDTATQISQTVLNLRS